MLHCVKICEKAKPKIVYNVKLSTGICKRFTPLIQALIEEVPRKAKADYGTIHWVVRRKEIHPVARTCCGMAVHHEEARAL